MLAPVIAEIAEAASELLPVEIVELGVKEGGITQHEAVLGVLAVGAVHVGDPGNDEILDYSDQRPTRIYFPTEETRKMPDLIAETCVPVTGAGGVPSTFFGTSTASSHVAGVAALLADSSQASQLIHGMEADGLLEDRAYDTNEIIAAARKSEWTR